MNNILWIGYTAQLYPIQAELKIALEREIDEAYDAKTGLEKAVGIYPLILVNDFVPAGGLALPGSLRPDDAKGIACLVLRELRKMETHADTPIVVPVNGYVDKMDYYLCGATDVCNKSVMHVRETVARYLAISASLSGRT
jgi:hypothetical protein